MCCVDTGQQGLWVLASKEKRAAARSMPDTCVCAGRAGRQERGYTVTEETKNRRVEVLAPAGSFESLVAAAESGADAVYFGGTQFSARQYADNFDNDDLARAIDYLHVRGIKAYLTVNTLLYDDEMLNALRLAAAAYSMGIDALIVQDIGFAMAVRRLLPDLELHASTQMTVHNPQGARALSELGFSRVILARELSLSDIAAIKKVCGPIELEVFVHGAICISYSGQCLMSSMVGGRSGNRGRCAQPCRLEYSLVELNSCGPARGFEPDRGRLLSPSDLCLIECLPELIKAGVASFKIEGRMKGPEYVATVTRAYRWAVDKYYETRQVPADELREVIGELQVIFNRGFTKAYFYGRPAEDLMSPGRSSNRGAYVGRVVQVDSRGPSQSVVVRLEADLSRGDRIEIWISKGGRVRRAVDKLMIRGTTVDSAASGDEVEIEIGGQVRVGDRVFKTRDAEVERTARQSYASPRAQRQLPVRFEAEAVLGKPFRVRLTDSHGNQVASESSYIVEPALRQPTTASDIEANLSRTGNTPFAVDSIAVKMDSGVMVPRSVVNECRRDCIAKLESRRAEAFHRQSVTDSAVLAVLQASTQGADSVKQNAKTARRLPGVSVSTTTFRDIDALVEAKPDRVYLSLECFGNHPDCLWDSKRLREAVELVSSSDIETYIRLPRILKAHEIDEVVGLLASLIDDIDLPVIGILVGGLGSACAVADALNLAPGASFHAKLQEEGAAQSGLRDGVQVRLHADYSVGITNSSAIKALKAMGFIGVTLSPELNISRIRSLAVESDMVNEIVVHGRLPLMISEQCIVGYLSQCTRKGCRFSLDGRPYGLLDRKGYVFPLLSDRYCRTYLLNSMCMCMVDSMNDLLTLEGINLYRIEGYGESNAALARVVSAYRNAISGEAELPACESLVGSGGRGFTRGHFYRGAD